MYKNNKYTQIIKIYTSQTCGTQVKTAVHKSKLHAVHRSKLRYSGQNCGTQVKTAVSMSKLRYTGQNCGKTIKNKTYTGNEV